MAFGHKSPDRDSDTDVSTVFYMYGIYMHRFVSENCVYRNRVIWVFVSHNAFILEMKLLQY